MTLVRIGFAAAAAVVLAAAPGGAATPAPQSIVLAGTASCTLGDVDITYAANGATRRTVSFTAADGSVLYQVEGKALGPDFSGTEHVLADAKQAQPAGTLLGVHVTVGTTPPAADTTAEFFVLYRCSPEGNDKGGTNTIVQECHGPFGTCPTTAAGAVASPAPSTTAAPPGDPGAASGAGGGASSGPPSSGSGSGAGGSTSGGPVGSVAPGGTVAAAPGPDGSTPGGTAPTGSAPGTTSADTSSTSPSSLAWLVPVTLVVLGVLAAIAGIIVRRRPS